MNPPRVVLWGHGWGYIMPDGRLGLKAYRTRLQAQFALRRALKRLLKEREEASHEAR